MMAAARTHSPPNTPRAMATVWWCECVEGRWAGCWDGMEPGVLDMGGSWCGRPALNSKKKVILFYFILILGTLTRRNGLPNPPLIYRVLTRR